MAKEMNDIGAPAAESLPNPGQPRIVPSPVLPRYWGLPWVVHMDPILATMPRLYREQVLVHGEIGK